MVLEILEEITNMNELCITKIHKHIVPGIHDLPDIWEDVACSVTVK